MNEASLQNSFFHYLSGLQTFKNHVQKGDFDVLKPPGDIFLR
jgi:hypothetical protein